MLVSLPSTCSTCRRVKHLKGVHYSNDYAVVVDAFHVKNMPNSQIFGEYIALKSFICGIYIPAHVAYAHTLIIVRVYTPETMNHGNLSRRKGPGVNHLEGVYLLHI